MRILAVSDYESPYLWDFYEPGRLDGIDLILSAGDLSPEYLSFLATFSEAPVLYVRGNHDPRYDYDPPQGCICVDDSLYVYNGKRILGLGGSMYFDGGECQYTEKDMRLRVRKLSHMLHRRHGFDILLAHAPAKGVHDGDYLPYRGFESFCDLMDRYNPRYFIHGHVHKNYTCDFHRTDMYNKTTVINAYEYYIFDF